MLQFCPQSPGLERPGVRLRAAVARGDGAAAQPADARGRYLRGPAAAARQEPPQPQRPGVPVQGWAGG